MSYTVRKDLSIHSTKYSYMENGRKFQTLLLMYAITRDR